MRVVLCGKIESKIQTENINSNFPFEGVFCSSREFFRLLMMDIGANASLISGMDGRRTALHNTVALEKQEFFNVGRCIVTVVQGLISSVKLLPTTFWGSQSQQYQ